jgi:transposase-like protein
MNTRTPCCAWLVFPAALVSPLVAQDVEFFTRRANLVLEQVASSCIAMSFSCQRFVDRACKKQPGSSGRSGTMAGAKHRFGCRSCGKSLSVISGMSSGDDLKADQRRQLRQCAATWADLRVSGWAGTGHRGQTFQQDVVKNAEVSCRRG